MSPDVDELVLVRRHTLPTWSMDTPCSLGLERLREHHQIVIIPWASRLF